MTHFHGDAAVSAKPARHKTHAIFNALRKLGHQFLTFLSDTQVQQLVLYETALRAYIFAMQVLVQ